MTATVSHLLDRGVKERDWRTERGVHLSPIARRTRGRGGHV